MTVFAGNLTFSHVDVWFARGNEGMLSMDCDSIIAFMGPGKASFSLERGPIGLLYEVLLMVVGYLVMFSYILV